MTDIDTPLYDPDARLGGHDDPTLLESLHEEAEKVRPRRTRYEVQVRVEDANDAPAAWMPVRVIDASGARDALRQASTDGMEPVIHPGDRLRAIPLRNITELTLDVETTTRMRLS